MCLHSAVQPLNSGGSISACEVRSAADSELNIPIEESLLRQNLKFKRKILCSKNFFAKLTSLYGNAVTCAGILEALFLNINFFLEQVRKVLLQRLKSFILKLKLAKAKKPIRYCCSYICMMFYLNVPT